MKPETISETLVSQTAASGFHLSSTLDWQSESVRQRNCELKLAVPLTEVLRVASIPVEPEEDDLLSGIRPFPKRGGIVTNGAD